MRLILAVKLHRELRIQQEVLCELCCQHSIDRAIKDPNFEPGKDIGDFPRLEEFSRINSTVHRLERIIPNWYFNTLDVLHFFGIDLLQIRQEAKEKLKCQVNSRN
jgi:hypothetical protein